MYKLINDVQSMNLLYSVKQNPKVCDYMLIVLVLTLSFLIIATKNNARATNSMADKINSNSEDSISGIKRSSFDTITRMANIANAMATYKIRFVLSSIRKSRDIAKRIAANIPVPKSKNPARFPLSSKSALSLLLPFTTVYVCCSYNFVHV